MRQKIDTFTKELTERLIQCAKKAGGKRALAKKTTISEAQLFRYINGTSPLPSNKLIAIAEAVHLSPAWLLSGEGDSEAPKNTLIYPSFNPKLLENIIQSLEELLIEYEKNFTPAQRAKAISFIYKALRHEETKQGATVTITKPTMLGYINFLADIKSEEILTALSDAVNFFEYTQKSSDTDYKTYAGEFSAFVNYLSRAYEHYYNSASGRAYFDRLGTQILPYTAKQLDEIVHIVQKTTPSESLKVLDIGCGGGRDISYLHRHYANIHIHGVDQSQLAIDICERLIQTGHLPQNCLKKSDVRTLPYPNETFHLLTSRQTFYCLPHLPKSGLGVESLMQEAHRTLKKSGYFYILSLHGEGKEYLPFCQYYTQEIFQQLAEDNGFQIVFFKKFNIPTMSSGCRTSAVPYNQLSHTFRALLQKKK